MCLTIVQVRTVSNNTHVSRGKLDMVVVKGVGVGALIEAANRAHDNSFG